MRLVKEQGLTCREVVELVTDYLDDALPLGERIRFERHLDDCPHCMIYLEQMRATIKAVGRLTADELDDTVRSELLQAFREWPRPETG